MTAQATPQSRAWQYLLGASMMFVLPALLVTLPYYVLVLNDLPPASGWFQALRVVWVVSVAFFLFGANLLLGSLRLRVHEVLGWSEKKCVIGMMPVLLLGPLLFHLYNLALALRLKRRLASYWSLAGILGGCAQWLSLFWSFAGLASADFRTGFWFGLAGILSFTALTATYLQLRRTEDSIPRFAWICSAILLLCWLGLQIFQCHQAINEENLTAQEYDKLLQTADIPENLDSLHAYEASGDPTKLFQCDVRLTTLLDSKTLAALLFPNGKQPALELLQDAYAKCAADKTLFPLLDEICQGDPLRITWKDLDDLPNLENAVRSQLRAACVYSLRIAHAIEIQDKSELSRSLDALLWLADIPAATLNVYWMRLGILQLRANCLPQCKALLEKDAWQRETQWRDTLLEQLPAQNRQAILNGAAIIRARMKRAGQNAGTPGSTAAALQTLGGLLCNPLYTPQQNAYRKGLASLRQLLASSQTDQATQQLLDTLRAI